MLSILADSILQERSVPFKPGSVFVDERLSAGLGLGLRLGWGVVGQGVLGSEASCTAWVDK